MTACHVQQMPKQARSGHNILNPFAGIGLALGGGIGYLSRAYGLTTDQIVNATVVVANGTTVRTSIPAPCTLQPTASQAQAMLTTLLP